MAILGTNNFLRASHITLLFVVVLAVLIFIGCSKSIVQVDESEASILLPMIQDGITTKQELRQRLGDPFESYNDGLIIIYFVADRGADKLEVINNEQQNYSWAIAVYQLVLVFDSNYVLTRHSLVQAF